MIHSCIITQSEKGILYNKQKISQCDEKDKVKKAKTSTAVTLSSLEDYGGYLRRQEWFKSKSKVVFLWSRVTRMLPFQ